LSKKFQTDSVYISFYSMFSRSITVTVSFASPPKPRHIREQEKLEKQMALTQQTQVVPHTPSEGQDDARSSAPNSPKRVENEHSLQASAKKPLDKFEKMFED
jgi:hypothetical protein